MAASLPDAARIRIPGSGRAAGTVRLALLSLLWGSSFLWMKIGLRGLSPVQIATVRVALGATVLLVIVAATGGRFPRERGVWAHLAVAALVANAVPFLLFAEGERGVSSALAGALNASTPVLTLLVSGAVGQERLTAPRVVGIAVGLGGCVVALEPWASTGSGTLTGALECIGASACYAVSFVYVGRYLAGRGIGPVVLSAGQLILATGWMLLALPFGGLDPVRLSWKIVLAMAVLGILGTGIAYILNYRIITDEGPTVASTVTYVIPVVAVVLGAVVLDEPMTYGLLAGGAAVLAGVGLVRRPRPSI